MAKKKRKSTDPNVMAFNSRLFTEEKADDKPTNKPSEKKVDPAVSEAARALSKLGASKGGKARAEKLSQKHRSEIAKKAAKKRWSLLSN